MKKSTEIHAPTTGVYLMPDESFKTLQFTPTLRHPRDQSKFKLGTMPHNCCIYTHIWNLNSVNQVIDGVQLLYSLPTTFFKKKKKKKKKKMVTTQQPPVTLINLPCFKHNSHNAHRSCFFPGLEFPAPC